MCTLNYPYMPFIGSELGFFPTLITISELYYGVTIMMRNISTFYCHQLHRMTTSSDSVEMWKDIAARGDVLRAQGMPAFRSHNDMFLMPS